MFPSKQTNGLATARSHYNQWKRRKRDIEKPKVREICGRNERSWIVKMEIWKPMMWKCQMNRWHLTDTVQKKKVSEKRVTIRIATNACEWKLQDNTLWMTRMSSKQRSAKKRYGLHTLNLASADSCSNRPTPKCGFVGVCWKNVLADILGRKSGSESPLSQTQPHRRLRERSDSSGYELCISHAVQNPYSVVYLPE